MDNQPQLEARMRKFERHLVTEKGLSPVTAAMRRRAVGMWLSRWQTLNPSRQQVQEAKETMLYDGYHKGYVRNVCWSLRDYGEWLGHDLEVKAPRARFDKVPRFLTEEEVQSILFVIDSIRDRALFYLMAYSGARASEVCKTKREHVHFDTGALTIQEGKGGNSSEIPLARSALEAIGAYTRSGLWDERQGYLFTGPDGRPLSTQRLRVLCRRYARKAGLTKAVSPHMFRHALATNLLAKGCPLPFVQRQLRHSRIETTMIYLHLTDKALRENYERFLPEY